MEVLGPFESSVRGRKSGLLGLKKDCTEEMSCLLGLRVSKLEVEMRLVQNASQ